MDTLKLTCRKCAANQGFVGGLALDGTMAVDDGVGCPICSGTEEGEEVGKILSGE